MFKSNLLTVILILSVSSLAISQIVDTLPLDIDANVFRISDGTSADKNHGTSIFLNAAAGTNNFRPTKQRAFFNFDLSGISQNASVIVARLYLYPDRSAPGWADGHIFQDSSNSSVIQRVLRSWDEYNITWNNQPQSTSFDQVFLAKSYDKYQEYVVDMTDLIQYDIENPSESHGYVLKLRAEEPYRRMIFASSDNENPDIHPKLVITYNVPTSVDDNFRSASTKVYPNPFSDQATLTFSHPISNQMSLKIFDPKGRLVYSQNNLFSNTIMLDKDDLGSGMFFYQLQEEGKVLGKGNFIVK